MNVPFDEKHFTGEIPIGENGQAPDEMNIIRQKALIDLSKRITEPPALLEIFENDNHRRFGSAGDFSLIIGKAKSRKSWFIILLVSALLYGKLFMEKLKPCLPVLRRRVILIDTEQSHYDVQTLKERILRTAQVIDNPDIEVYHFRRFDTSERIKLIEHIIYNSPGLSVVVIDGIRDLVTDINSPEEASYIKDKILKWTEELNIHIITVLHQNKGDNNARGHIGTELINKAETVISIAKDQRSPELSIVTPEQTRGREFKPFAFLINADSLPEIIDRGIEPDQEPGKKTIYPNDFPAETHTLIIEGIFSATPYYKLSDMIEEIKTGFRAYNVNFGSNKAREFLSHWLKNKRIEKGREPKIRWEVYKPTVLTEVI